MNVEGYIGLGSNIGDRIDAIMRAVEAIDAMSGVAAFRLSTLIETAPVGNQDQPDFVNAVLQVRSRLEPVQMLDQLLGLELEMGRDRSIGEDGGPRLIDLDLLVWGDHQLHMPGLILPHPRLAERAFVLIPMVELAPNLIHPVLGRSMQELLVEEIKANGPLEDRCRPAGHGPLLDGTDCS
ncbi:MAG: 2-amino-4-hydroxy-6-hydroxymethyldihydropteridine diphosphokinase [Phycisphaerae bacterium]|nr:2-amino-4-hydroxy-6-hydroxymethyldihydropteridine diphosphokinase [Phycisphaerae bacterium]|tara:strand:+ start:816 stop:1358 length:543 start_codon:yes stop_codon:yes gene_type:complete